jgi:hypothetical protein
MAPLIKEGLRRGHENIIVELAREKSRITGKFNIKKPFVFWSCHRKENMLTDIIEED